MVLRIMFHDWCAMFGGEGVVVLHIMFHDWWRRQCGIRHNAPCLIRRAE